MYGGSHSPSGLPSAIKLGNTTQVYIDPLCNGTGSWQTLKVGTQQNQIPTAGTFGPILTFGYNMGLAHPNKIYCIHHSVKGTSLKGHWNPYATSGSMLFQKMLNCVEFGFQKLRDQGLNPIAKGAIRMQGEADRGETDISYFEPLLFDYWEMMIDRMENDMGIDTSQMKNTESRIHNKFAEPGNCEAIRTAQVNFGNTFPNARWYNTDHLGIADLTHYNFAGYKLFGEELAAYYSPLI
jgi:hypothetical protein